MRIDKRTLVGLEVLILICLLGFTPKLTSATLIWSDTFDELNEEYWDCVACQIIDGALHGVKPPSNTLLDRSAVRAYRESNVSVGTWKFDLTEIGEWGEELDIMKIYFISPELPGYSYYYALSIVHTSSSTGDSYSYTLEKWYDSLKLILDDYIGKPQASVKGTLHHFAITRTGAGLISVYLNSSLILQAADTDIDITGYFGFYTWDDWALDNVYVYNTVENSVGLPLILGGIAIVAIVAVAIVYVVRRR